MNKVLLLGNVGKEPELRYTQGGTASLEFSLATSERWKDKSGEWKERTSWHRVKVWGGQAEGLSKILSKGSKVFVEGRIDYQTSEGRNGEKRYFTNIVAEQVMLCGEKRSAPPTEERQQSLPQGRSETWGTPPEDPGEIPF